jgi:hypothetical protein
MKTNFYLWFSLNLNLKKKKKKYREKDKSLHMLARSMNLTRELEMKIKRYMEFIWDQEEKVNPGLEHLIMGKLSPSLRDEVYSETYLKYLRSVNLFNKNFSLATLLKLAQAMTKICFLPEEKIYSVSKK